MKTKEKELETTKLWHIDAVQIFQDLPYETKMNFVDNTITKKYRKNDLIIAQGDKMDYFYCIAKGRVKRSRKVKDEEFVIRTYAEGEFFGELSLVLPNVLAEADRDYVSMKHDTVVCAIPLDIVKACFEENPAMKEQMLYFYASEFYKQEIRLDSVLFKDVKHQLIDFIKALARDIGKPIGKEVIVRHQYTHQDISNLTGISRQKVTTLLNEFKREGLIYFERKNILIKDKKLLY